MFIRFRKTAPLVIIFIVLASCSNEHISSKNEERNIIAEDIQDLESESYPTSSFAETKGADVESSLDDNLYTISFEEIKSLLRLENKNVIENLGILDTDKEYGIGTENFYVPLFRCESSAIYICFDGSRHDVISDILSRKDETPLEIIPFSGATIVFNDKYSFCVGDDVKNFIEYFGEGVFEEYSNLKGDKQTYHLKFQVDSIKVQFSSYDREFSDYLMIFSKEDAYAESPNSLSDTVGITYKEYLNNLKYLDELEGKISEATTTAELIEATGNAHYSWDVELNKIYALLLEKLSSDDIEKLKTEERLWIKEKDRRAEEYADVFKGGSFATVAYNDILFQCTKLRTLELILVYFNNSNDFSFKLSELQKSNISEPSITINPDIYDLEFADLAKLKFFFASGVGAWSTELEIMTDGTFVGYHHDSDMGDTGPGYPNGTRYYCSFSGRFSSLQKTGEYEYSLKCEAITQEGVEGEVKIGDDGIRYITSYPYGLDNADILFLYLPGKQVNSLPEEFLSWVGMPRVVSLENDGVLDFYGLYNVNGEQGFSGNK